MARPITPGEIVLEEYLLPMGISQNAMARAIGVPPRAVNDSGRGPSGPLGKAPREGVNAIFVSS